MSKKILIVVGGGTKHLKPFNQAGEELGVEVKIASFSTLELVTKSGTSGVRISGEDPANYDVVYLRLVGRRYEDAALLVYYLRKKGIRIVDHTYEKDGLIRIPIPKSVESKILEDLGVPLPRTFFARMKTVAEIAPDLFGFPFVIKGTSGKQGNAVWSPKNGDELKELVEKFSPLEKAGQARFLAQEFIKASQRNRVFVIGDRAIAAITRPTRWRKRFQERVDGEYPEGKRHALVPIPEEDADLAVKAAQALGVEIGGADIITEDATGKKYVLEVNSAPRWDSIKKDAGINVEKEILKYLSSI